MTIAIGVLTPVALLFGADSEESGADIRLATSKITFSYSMGVNVDQQTRMDRCVCITGAGDSGYLAVIKQEIIDISNSSEDLNEFENRLRESVRLFYRHHVLPFSRVRNLDLNFSLIVGARFLQESGMWLTELSAVRPLRNMARVAVGSGAQWAKSVMPPYVPLYNEHAAAAALYGLHVAKIRARDCGKESNLLYLSRQPGWAPLTADVNVIEEIERVFRRYDQFAEQMKSYVLGLPCPDLAFGVQRQLDKLNGEIASLLPQLFPSSGEMKVTVPSGPQE
jgi:hypothetical protein